MIRLLTDENFDQNIVRGLRRRLPQLDLVSVREAGLAGQPDMFLLQWAAQKNRIVLTHDISTMVPEANQLTVQGEPMAGVIFVPDQLQVGASD
jgi:predicted nuclease of predicted toxin-antitoxin system